MGIIIIKDFNYPGLEAYSKLSERELLNRDNPEKGIFIAESPKVIERALDAGYEPISLLIEDNKIETEGKNIINRVGNIPVYYASEDVLTELTGFRLTRGLLCAMKRKPIESCESFLKKYNKIAVLESVMNPTNAGAIVRSAAALNMDAILITSDSSDLLYRRAIRVSMGTVFQIPWAEINYNDWYSNGINLLKENGFKTISFALTDNSVSIKDKCLKSDKTAVILGNEGYGLSEKTIKESDYTVKIPMSHGVDSLNVSAAAAVAFWELGNGRLI